MSSQIFRSLGVVTKGQLVETDRSGLVAGFVGQTAAQTQKVLTSAFGGTLLIDEAYALARGGENDFGLESVDTIVKFMEDHRDDLSIVAAGYPAEMQELIDSNPGLSSWFARTIHFPDSTTEELIDIFSLISESNEYHLDDPADDQLTTLTAAGPTRSIAVLETCRGAGRSLRLCPHCSRRPPLREHLQCNDLEMFTKWRSAWVGPVERPLPVAGATRCGVRRAGWMSD